MAAALVPTFTCHGSAMCAKSAATGPGPPGPAAWCWAMTPKKAIMATRPLASSLRFKVSKSLPLDMPIGSNLPPGYKRSSAEAAPRWDSANAMRSVLRPMTANSGACVSLPRYFAVPSHVVGCALTQSP